MTRLLASILLAFALLLSPMAMVTGGGAAMAHSTMTTMDGDCAGMHHSSTDDKKSDAKMSCAAACAALPGKPTDIRGESVPPKSAKVPPAAQVLTSVRPEGETPPPRITSEV